jgi:hypothetical protein
MIFYHRTNHAEAILQNGFHDSEGSYGLEGMTLRGVFLSNVPVGCNEGAKGDQLLEVTLPETCCDLGYYELVQIDEPITHYREWCLPAAIINQHGKIRLLSDEEEQNIWSGFTSLQ